MAILEVEVRVECDQCSNNEVFHLHTLDSYYLRRALESEGWEVDYRCSDFLCPDCTEERDTEEEEDEDDDFDDDEDEEE